MSTVQQLPDAADRLRRALARSRERSTTATQTQRAISAELAAGDAAPRVYVVEPTGEFENNPNVTDKKFPGNPTRSYRSREPLGAGQPPQPVQPAEADRQQQPGQDGRRPQRGEGGDQGDHDQRRAEAELQVQPAPQRPEPRAAPQPGPAALDRLDHAAHAWADQALPTSVELLAL